MSGPETGKQPAGGQPLPQAQPKPDNDPTAGRDSLGKVLRRNLSLARLNLLWRRAQAALQKGGWQGLWREVVFRLRLATHREVWRYRADIPLKRELRAQRRHALALGKAVMDAGGPADGRNFLQNVTIHPNNTHPAPQKTAVPTVSVVVPLYNTPLPYLRQMINSVRRQSWPRWQLVLADASDGAYAKVGRVALGYAKKDARICYHKLPQNGGIAQNTNAAFVLATGDWLALLDHDDVLQPNALYEVAAAAQGGAALVYSDEIVLDEKLRRLGEYHFKGDYGPDTLRGCNYITHLCAFSRALLDSAGGERSAYDGAQDYDLILRLTQAAGAAGIKHIPKVLYFWRRHGGSTAAGIAQKPAATLAGQHALQAHLDVVQPPAGKAEPSPAHPGAYRVHYKVEGAPLVSVLIPSCDHTDDLARCLASLYEKGGWPSLEVLVLDNNSKNPATPAFYQTAAQQYPNLRVLHWPPQGTAPGFNFSAINNFGARMAQGQHLLLLNNDVELLGEGFVRELLSYSQRPDVGAVGAKLYYPDDTIQHAGLIVGIGGTAGVSHKGHRRADGGDMFRLCTTQNVSAVTGAALMVKRELYLAAGGLDETSFAVAFNDVDFCLRLRQQGLWNVFTPFAEARHYESKSRGYDIDGPNKQRFEREAAALRARWADVLAAGDPFYNPHFTLETENFAYR